MSETPIYSFLPWVRNGVANSIVQADADPAVKLRASIPIDVTLAVETLAGDPQSPELHKVVQLYGPGDIVGVEQKAVVKTEPHDWITNFEPNLLPYIEFYDEDFPWRYTPAKPGGPNGARLRPWITLVVLMHDNHDPNSDEFEEVKAPGGPLPRIKLANGKSAKDLFPASTELWAWAHVHVNRKIDVNAPAAALQQTVAENDDLASSRLICPRRLRPETTYHAFLIPSFESGRLAGLGQPVPATLMATKSAWDDGQVEFPYYYRWRFRTSVLGDFEYLVRLLKPQPCDKRVGVRDIDVVHVGANLPKIDKPENLGKVLKLGGALRVPLATMSPLDRYEVEKYDQWDEEDYPHKFQQALAARINLADDYQVKPPGQANPDEDPDPIVTSPLYGRWHALTSRLLEQRDHSAMPNPRNWVHELNLDPRFRGAAGLGTRIVQEHQEEYMDAAWQQAGQVLEANRLLELMQLARQSALRVHERSLLRLDPSRRLMLTAPVQRRLMAGSMTMRAAVERSVLPYAAMSPTFRSMVRSRGRLVGRFSLSAPGQIQGLVNRLSIGQLVAAPTWKGMPGGLSKDFLRDAAMRLPVNRPGAKMVTEATRQVLVQKFAEKPRKPESARQLPQRPNFVLSKRGHAKPAAAGNTDSPEAARFRQALADAYEVAQPRGSVPQRGAIDVKSLADDLASKLHPDVTIPRRYASMVTLPPRLVAAQAEPFVPCMVYPEFDTPMYEPLSKLSSELFLPNINLIPQNSMTLLEPNQKFIESYMLGLNHEMGRELLWREYPTDQRGSYFRQFWDVSSLLVPTPPSQALRNQLRDIPAIHMWKRSDGLGTHNQRQPVVGKEPLVLVVRGELLKRYPNAVIYAMKAKWAQPNGQPDIDKERELVKLTAMEEDNPPKAKLLTPLFEARVHPDIFFIGFDLTAAQARGRKDNEPALVGANDNAGWFFILQERPGEPRFGLDQPPPSGPGPTLFNWNALHWGRVGTAEGACMRIDKTIVLTPPGNWNPNSADADNKPNPEDAAAHFSPQTSAAELAYILYQVPAMVAVHASRMLP